MKWSCPAVLVFVANVQLDKRVVEAASRYTVDEGVETKVQSNAVIVPELEMAQPCDRVHHRLKAMERYMCVCGNQMAQRKSLRRVHKGKGSVWESVIQWGDGTLHMGSICGKAHNLPDNAHSNGQHSIGRWNVTHGFDSRQSSPPATHTFGNGQHTSGAMVESSKTVGKGEHTVVASLEYTLVLVSVAVPGM